MISNTLKNILIEKTVEIEKAQIEAYKELLSFYEENKDELAKLYFINDLKQIIYTMEVKEDYNTSLELMRNLNQKINDLNCKPHH